MSDINKDLFLSVKELKVILFKKVEIIEIENKLFPSLKRRTFVEKRQEICVVIK